ETAAERRPRVGGPNGIRTRVTALKARCPRPTRRWGRASRRKTYPTPLADRVQEPDWPRWPRVQLEVRLGFAPFGGLDFVHSTLHRPRGATARRLQDRTTPSPPARIRRARS